MSQSSHERAGRALEFLNKGKATGRSHQVIYQRSKSALAEYM